MDITIYLLCYNEEVLLPHALDHYSKRFPKAKFIIINNMSTDSSVEIATARGCEIVPWETKNQANIVMNTDLKNNVWKTATTDWIIIADMDEWIELTEEQLMKEDAAGFTILHFRGVQMVADSKSLILDDVNLHDIKTGYYDINFNKHVCFKRTAITDIHYTRGAHKSAEKGLVKYSKNVYKLKHMNFLGLPWFEAKMKARFLRTHHNRHYHRCSGHYTNNDAEIQKKYASAQKAAKDIMST